MLDELWDVCSECEQSLDWMEYIIDLSWSFMTNNPACISLSLYIIIYYYIEEYVVFKQLQDGALNKERAASE